MHLPEKIRYVAKSIWPSRHHSCFLF